MLQHRCERRVRRHGVTVSAFGSGNRRMRRSRRTTRRICRSLSLDEGHRRPAARMTPHRVAVPATAVQILGAGWMCSCSGSSTTLAIRVVLTARSHRKGAGVAVQQTGGASVDLLHRDVPPREENHPDPECSGRYRQPTSSIRQRATSKRASRRQGQQTGSTPRILVAGRDERRFLPDGVPPGDAFRPIAWPISEVSMATPCGIAESRKRSRKTSKA